jgi:hypothetical protein
MKIQVTHIFVLFSGLEYRPLSLSFLIQMFRGFFHSLPSNFLAVFYIFYFRCIE